MEALKYIEKELEYQKVEHDRLQDQINELKVSKKRIYDYIDEKIKEVKGDIDMVEKTITELKDAVTASTITQVKAINGLLLKVIGVVGAAAVTLVVFIYLNGVK